MCKPDEIGVYAGKALAAYGFGHDHPFGPDRYDAFWREFSARGLDTRVRLLEPAVATRAELELFHSPEYLAFVAERCEQDYGWLDGGDTPAERGADLAAAAVVGSTLDAVRRVQRGEIRRAFVPIGGLHHAGRAHAAGFCIYSDIGVAIEALRREAGVRRIAYVDIDAHHGDGVFYAYESDPALVFADLHEDGRFLYPGTGHAHETGRGPAAGTKLNVPMPPGADDALFFEAWEKVERHLASAEFDFVLFQCGADSIAGDPLTHLRYSPAAHAHAAARLAALADERCGGRLVVMGGGGYDRRNLALAWTAVVEALLAN
ncbi:MAG TPA: acetoin utilization protein AcuC [Gammaproteobacteria bacterium]|nr:acetoin utilization protein AcuC [Gammaproteobacteria bacterium]